MQKIIKPQFKIKKKIKNSSLLLLVNLFYFQLIPYSNFLSKMSAEKASRIPPLRLLLVAVLVSCGASYHFGYQLTLTNPCQYTFLSFVNDSFIVHYNTTLKQTQLEVSLC